jgi:hypothetical protein
MEKMRAIPAVLLLLHAAGFACPTVVRFPGRDRSDLVVGAIDGKFRRFVNTGEPGRPRLGPPDFLRAGGSIASVPMG